MQGRRVVFTFAGGTQYGIVEEENKRLSKEYGIKWYWVRDPVNNVRYPVSIKNMVETK